MYRLLSVRSTIRLSVPMKILESYIHHYGTSLYPDMRADPILALELTETVKSNG